MKNSLLRKTLIECFFKTFLLVASTIISGYLLYYVSGFMKNLISSINIKFSLSEVVPVYIESVIIFISKQSYLLYAPVLSIISMLFLGCALYKIGKSKEFSGIDFKTFNNRFSIIQYGINGLSSIIISVYFFSVNSLEYPDNIPGFVLISLIFFIFFFILSSLIFTITINTIEHKIKQINHSDF